MRLDIRYRSVFTYDDVVREAQNELRACPTSDERQQVVAYRLTTSPSARVVSFTDYWGTQVDAFGVREPHVSMEIIAEAAVDTAPRPAISVMPRIDAVHDPEFRDRHGEYLERSLHVDWGPRATAEAQRILDFNGPDLIRTVVAVNGLVGGRLVYEPGSTHIGIAVEEVLGQGRGVCQDFAHVAVALCRSLGIPARYVSGYLFTSNDATGAQVEGDLARVQTHAWFEAAIPGLGWLALDPTNRLEVGQQHVKIGHGRDYDDVPPLRGTYSGHCQPHVEAQVEIRRMEVSRQPATLVQPSAPRALESRHRHQQAQQQQ